MSAASIKVQLIREKMGLRAGRFTFMVSVSGPLNSFGARPAMECEIFPERYPTNLRNAVKHGAAACAEKLLAAGKGIIEPTEAFNEAGRLFDDALITAKQSGVIPDADDTADGSRLGGDVNFEKDMEGKG